MKSIPALTASKHLRKPLKMSEGAVSARMGLGGLPAIAESIPIFEALAVAAYESARLHVCHVSSADSLEHLARVKDAGAPVTAEVCPHHLTLTDECVVTLDPNFKMSPPLRTETDRQALVKALADGLIDCVATDHAPHVDDEWEVPFEEAPFGVVGLETAFAVLYETLVTEGALSLACLVDRMSQSPARLAGIPEPTVAEGAEANLCLVDPAADWRVTRSTLRSRSYNSPWLGKELSARVVLTLAAGHVAWDASA